MLPINSRSCLDVARMTSAGNSRSPFLRYFPKALARHTLKFPYGERLTLAITEESRRGVKIDVVLAGVERIGEREGTNEMRHGRAFREKENAFSRNARLGE